MSIWLENIVFVGFNKRVVALDRLSGDICWMWKPKCKGGSFTTLILERDLLIVSIGGYMWALDPLNGEEKWHNPLKGMGTGVASMVSATNPNSQINLQAAAQVAAVAAAAAAS
jgi:outer membrane protein assembly factor BamB